MKLCALFVEISDEGQQVHNIMMVAEALVP